MHKAVFLDRDGVLNVDHGYVFRAEQFEWMADAREAIAWINRSGYLAVVVTNQSGVGRGLYTEADVASLHAWMQDELKPFGARIDAFYMCPHHPSEAMGEYRIDCACRKPKPGMVLQAAGDLDVDLSGSILLGDKDRDLQAAAAAGVRGVLYTGGSVLQAVRQALSS